MHGHGYQERMNWYTILKKNKPPWGRTDMALTAVTQAMADFKPGDAPLRHTFIGYETNLRPPGYARSDFLAGLTSASYRTGSLTPIGRYIMACASN